MDEEQRKTFKESLLQLPLPIQRAILESDWEEKVIKIGQSHKLYFDQIDALIAETSIVLLGLATPGEFHNNLIDAIEVDKPEVLDAIEREVYLMVFKPIHDEVLEETAHKDQQFTLVADTESTSTPPTTNTPFSPVVKIAPETHTTEEKPSAQSGDPYQEPIV